jgi:hypothetical protein
MTQGPGIQMIKVKDLKEEIQKWPDDHVIMICSRPDCQKIRHMAADLAKSTMGTRYFCSQKCHEQYLRDLHYG